MHEADIVVRSPAVAEHLVVADAAPEAANTAAEPERVLPRSAPGAVPRLAGAAA